MPYSEWNRLRRIMKSHAFRLVPRSNRSMLAHARRMASCTRSSARSRLLVSEIANPRRLRRAASLWYRREFSTMSGGGPSVCFDLTDEESHAWRERQATHFGIHLAQFRADLLLLPQSLSLSRDHRLSGMRN